MAPSNDYIQAVDSRNLNHGTTFNKKQSVMSHKQSSSNNFSQGSNQLKKIHSKKDLSNQQTLMRSNMNVIVPSSSVPTLLNNQQLKQKRRVSRNNKLRHNES